MVCGIWHFDLNLGISFWVSQTAHDAPMVQHHAHCLPANILGLYHAVKYLWLVTIRMH